MRRWRARSPRTHPPGPHGNPPTWTHAAAAPDSKPATMEPDGGEADALRRHPVTGMSRDSDPPRAEPYFSRTKVTPPVSSRYEVPRQAILQRVRESDRAVVVIHAPAGFGKTTLMTQLRADAEARGEA